MGAWGERNQNFSSKPHEAMTSCTRQPQDSEVLYPLPCMPSPPPIFINLSDIPPPPPARALYTMEDILIDIMDYRPSTKKEKSKSKSDDDDDDDDDVDDDVTALTGAPVTPSTSASSSPSLPSSTPPPTPPPPIARAAAIARRGSIRSGRMMGRLASSVPAEEEDDEEGGASPSTSSSSSGWRIPASRKSMRTRNPIRAIVDPIMAAEMARGGDDDEYPTTTARKDQISLAVSGCISPYQSLSTYIASVGRCHHPSIHPSIHPPSLVAPVSYTPSCLRRTHTHICIYIYLR